MKKKQTHFQAVSAFYIISVCTLLMLFVQPARAQYFETYMVKRIGNLMVFDVGSNHGMANNAQYELSIRKITKIPLLGITIKKSFKSLGYVQTTQIFPKFSVAKAVRLNPEQQYVAGGLFFLRPAQSRQIMQEYAAPKKQQVEHPLRQEDVMSIPQTVNDRDVTVFKSGRKNPFSFGPRYAFGFSNFYNAITESQEALLTDNLELYPLGSQITKDNPIGKGYGASFQKNLHKFVSVGLDYMRISTEGKLLSEPSEESANTNILQKWEINSSINLNIFSFTAYVGKFKRVEEFLQHRTNKGELIYYAGGGVDYATMNVTYDHRWERRESDSSIKIGTTSEKYSLKGYSGYHGLIGASYLIKAGRLFAELWYIKWQKSGLGNSMPVRVGFDIMF